MPTYPRTNTTNGYYLLSDFGCLANGMDCTIPFQTAINVATGVLPNGQGNNLPAPLVMDSYYVGSSGASTSFYLVSSTLIVPNGLALIGLAQAGANYPTINVQFAKNPSVVTSGNAPALGQNPADVFWFCDINAPQNLGAFYGVQLRDFIITFDTGMDLSGYVGGAALHFQNAKYVTVERVVISGCWNGILVDSSSSVVLRDVTVNAGSVSAPGTAPRYAVKCAGRRLGNPNSTSLYNCQFTGDVNGLVAASGYNSVNSVNCGALGCDRGYWSTIDGGVINTSLSGSLSIAEGTSTYAVPVAVATVPNYALVTISDLNGNSIIGFVGAGGGTNALTLVNSYVVSANSGSISAVGSAVSANLVGLVSSVTASGSLMSVSVGAAITIVLQNSTGFAVGGVAVVSDNLGNAFSGVVVSNWTSVNWLTLVVKYLINGTQINLAANDCTVTGATQYVYSTRTNGAVSVVSPGSTTPVPVVSGTGAAFPNSSSIVVTDGTRYVSGYIKAGGNTDSFTLFVTASSGSTGSVSSPAVVLGSEFSSVLPASVTVPTSSSPTATFDVQNGTVFNPGGAVGQPGDFVIVTDGTTSFSGSLVGPTSVSFTSAPSATLVVTWDGLTYNPSSLSSVAAGGIATRGSANTFVVSSLSVPVPSAIGSIFITISVLNASPFKPFQYVTISDGLNAFTGRVTQLSISANTISLELAIATLPLPFTIRQGAIVVSGGTVPNFFSHSLPSSDSCNRAVVLDDGGLAQFLGLQANESNIDNVVLSSSLRGFPQIFSDAAITNTRGHGFNLSGGSSVEIVGGSVRGYNAFAAGVLLNGTISSTISGLDAEAGSTFPSTRGLLISEAHRANCVTSLTGCSLDTISEGIVIVDSATVGSYVITGNRVLNAPTPYTDSYVAGNSNLSPRKIKGNLGVLKGLLSVASPTILMGTASQVNNTGFDATVLLTGTHLSGISVGGSAPFAPPTAGPTSYAVSVPANQSISVSLASGGTLSWLWYSQD